MTGRNISSIPYSENFYNRIFGKKQVIKETGRGPAINTMIGHLVTFRKK